MVQVIRPTRRFIRSQRVMEGSIVALVTIAHMLLHPVVSLMMGSSFLRCKESSVHCETVRCATLRNQIKYSSILVEFRAQLINAAKHRKIVDASPLIRSLSTLWRLRMPRRVARESPSFAPAYKCKSFFSCYMGVRTENDELPPGRP